MEAALVSSYKDSASLNIYNYLVNNFEFEKIDKKFGENCVFQLSNKDFKAKLFLIDGSLINAENIDNEIKKSKIIDRIDLIIFLSKHVSKENTPSFTAHSIGNWGNAGHGGRDKALCPTNPFFIKEFFIELNKNVGNYDSIKEKYEMTLEATHHGPFVECPAVFVEIGSTEKEWNDKNNGNVMAHCIINALKNINSKEENGENKKYKVAIGLGGAHYCSNFNKIMLKTDIAFSHICPKYMLEKLDADLLKQCMEKTEPKIDFAVLDWKGLGQHKEKTIGLLNELNIMHKRSDKISSY